VTGIRVRVKRHGAWDLVDLTQCTDEELRQTVQGRPRAELVAWIVGLAGWIRDHGPAGAR
jgi:hypothetical protein